MLGQELEGIEDTGIRGCYYGVVYYPKGWQERGYLYMAAVEIETPDDILGSALVVKTMLPSKCARFIHKGRYGDLGLTSDYIYQTWLPKSGQRLAGPFEIEYYGQDFRSPDNEESEREIYIPIK